MNHASDRVERGRAAYRQRLWPDAFAELSEADRVAPLGPADLDLLSTAAYLVGEDERADELSARGYHMWLKENETCAAARRACWLGLQLLLRGEGIRAAAWYARAAELVDGQDVAERGLLLLPHGLQQLDEGKAQDALATFIEVVEVGDRFDDPDVKAFGRLCRGQALIASDQVSAGMESLDEAMVAVSADEVTPLTTGIVYCGVIEKCHAVFDLRRAREWTTALKHWCDVQPGLVPYRGQCLVHRAEIMQLQGSWHDAVGEAQQACALLDGQPAAGAAFYELAELHRLRGEFGDAERCYREASRWVAAQPGLALLRLAQNRTDAAAAASRQAMAEAQALVGRLQGRLEHVRVRRLLSAHVEIMLAAGDVAAARAAADELQAMTGTLGAVLLQASASSVVGACLIAEGKGADALALLRDAWRAWQVLDAPYESARVRVLAAQAHRLLGDADAAEMELEAAAWVFEQLGAVPDLQRVRALSRRPTGQAAYPLTTREVEVLRLVATGMTNRGIGNELFLSEKTVARHVSNIHAKLGLSSRAAATAYAYENGLVQPRGRSPAQEDA